MSMNWPPGYQQKIKQIIGQSFEDGTPEFYSLRDGSDPKEAIKKIQLIIKQLRIVKTEINLDMKQIRTKYSDERGKVSEGGFWTGALSGQKIAGRARQIQRQELNKNQRNELSPYENCKQSVDMLITSMDEMKLEIGQFQAKTRNEGYTRQSIPDDVKIFVWNRDSGKCVKCGSNENLEYDHIIPVSKGGSNTARNLQLLCQTCNREKSNNIGVQGLPPEDSVTEPAQDAIVGDLELPSEGLGESTYKKANDYYNGIGDTSQDFEEAFNLYNQAAQLGCIHAYWKIGKMFCDGIGVKKDIKQGLENFKNGLRHDDGRCWAESAILFANIGNTQYSRKCWDNYFKSKYFKQNITHQEGMHPRGYYGIMYLYRGYTPKKFTCFEKEFVDELIPIGVEIIAWAEVISEGCEKSDPEFSARMKNFADDFQNLFLAITLEQKH